MFRGSVLPVEVRSLSKRTAEDFAVELDLPILAPDELYGSKLVAAFDRQHPRDLFDIAQLDRWGGLTDGMLECFVTYLAGHNRPVHEVLFPRLKPIDRVFSSSFQGMTRDTSRLEELESARERMLLDVPRRLTDAHRAFLRGLVRAEPDWSLLRCPHASELPALRWKVENLRRLRDTKANVFRAQAEELDRLLENP